MLLGAVVVVAVLAAVELTREAVVVHRLRRGVGDTWFHAADGRRWFRLDATRHDVPLAEISPFLQQAFVAVEDHRFYRHPGVDPIAVARATWRNLRAPGTVEGASTITQQLARTIFLSNKRSYLRKAREAVLSLVIEAELSKAQILELYLNRIYLSAGVYGVETMAQRVFGKPARQLTLAESALIAGLARAPAALSPWSNLAGARRRSHVVLARMREAGFIDEAQQRDARRARLVVRPYASDGGRHGYAQAYLRQQFRDEFGGHHPPDWRVDTTIDLDLQDAAERAVGRGLDRLRRPALQAALVAMDPATGDVLAMVGGRDYAQSAFNRATRSRRQPGSAFKPFVFAAALDHGMSPVTELTGLDALPAQGPDEWTPRNVHDDAPARLTLRTALFESNNRAAAALQQALGTRRVLRLASKAGLDDLPDVPSLALGTGLVSPLTLTAAYAAFPNGGLAVRPRGIGASWTTTASSPPSTGVGGADAVAAGGLPDGVDARRRRRPRHRGSGAPPGRALPRRQQDRHHRRLQGRVVRGVLFVDRRQGLGRLRPACHDRPRRLRRPRARCQSGPTSCSRRRAAPARRLPAASRRARHAALRPVAPPARGRLSALHRVFQGR
ncbi:MAG: transglycosylase domain-containing protein [Vicinamibacterales bacterium]